MYEVQKPTKWERVKDHFRENRNIYLAGGVCLVAGAVLGYSLKDEGDVFALEAAGDMALGDMDKSTHNTTNNVTVNMGGPMHKIVKNNSTGEVFESVTAAAESAGVSISSMSKHINGHTDHIFGDEYEIVGIGTA
jgi:hypothetical protein